MKITSILAIALLLITPLLCQGQQKLSYFVEIHTNIGYSGDFSNSVEYRSPSVNGNIYVYKRSHIFTRGFGISLGKYFSQHFGFKVSFGQIQYGFDFQGVTASTNIPVFDAYSVTYLDFSAGFLFRQKLSKQIKFISSASYHFNSSAREDSPSLTLNPDEASSLSLYTGLEFPMSGNRFFANAGFFFSYPLLTYNRNFIIDNEFLPYFVGLRVGFSYMF